ncbi:MAG: hypothetical protein O7D30_04570, partial [Rickettsia endosymbiont of Ixodes persulcatus]|nr:hypothetical protein [Rickettsia endosymbiont of Ixodes persulcatus]
HRVLSQSPASPPQARSYLLIYQVNEGNADTTFTRSFDHICLDYLSYGLILTSGKNSARVEQRPAAVVFKVN